MTSQRRVGFFLYDAGETGALYPVFEILESRRIDYKIYAITTALKILGDHTRRVASPQIEPQLMRPPESWQREDEFAPSIVSKVLEHLDCDLLITGMASRIQSQVLQEQQSRRQPAWTVFESFSEGYARFSNTYFLAKPDLILACSLKILDFFKSDRPGQRVEIVGQPSLERWVESAAKISRLEVLNKMGIKGLTKPLLVYAGGYGRDFAEALRLFVDFARRLKAEFEICIAPHPRSNRELETQTLAQFEMAAKIKVLSAEISTPEAAVAADLVVSHRSLVGTQALFIGRPTLYLDPFPARYKDLAIELGWSEQVQTLSEFEAALDRCLAQKPAPPDQLFKVAGIPTNAAQRIADLIELKLSSQ